MSSRVHKTSEKYVQSKPQIDRVRKMNAHTQRARNAARVVAQMDKTIESLLNHLNELPRRELLKVAKDHNIKGRHTMTKPKLVEAVREAMKR